MDKYDIHKTEKEHTTTLKRFAKLITDKDNQELIREFVEDCKLGLQNPEKNVVKSVGTGKLSRYIDWLIVWTDALPVNWKQAKDEHIRELLLKIKDNRISQRQNIGTPYSEKSKYLMVDLLKRFCRWLNMKKELPIKYQRIGIPKPKKTIPEYLTREQVEKLVLSSNNLMYQAVIMLLFDAGLRIEELMNLKIKDLHYIDTPTKNKLLRIDVRISKTGARNPELPIAQETVEKWLETHEDRNNPEAYLFQRNKKPLFYDTVRLYFKRLAKKVYPDTRVYPHLFRHSSATYYGSRINRQQLCIRYGWEFSSKMPDVYINRSGVENTQMVQQFETENMNELRKNNKKLADNVNVLDMEMRSLKEQITELGKARTEIKKMHENTENDLTEDSADKYFEMCELVEKLTKKLELGK